MAFDMRASDLRIFYLYCYSFLTPIHTYIWLFKTRVVYREGIPYLNRFKVNLMQHIDRK